MSKRKISGVVYSTDPDFKYEYEESEEPETLSPAQQDLRLWLERKGGGKVAVVVKGFIGKTHDFRTIRQAIESSLR